MKADYDKLNNDLHVFARRMSETARTLRRNPRSSLEVADQIEDLLDSKGYNAILTFEDAKRAIAEFEIPKDEDANYDTRKFVEDRPLLFHSDKERKAFARAENGSLFRIHANDVHFNRDVMSAVGSRIHTYDHIGMIRKHPHEGFLRISPSAQGFEVSHLFNWCDLFSHGTMIIDRTETLQDAISLARSFATEPTNSPRM